jgi:dihydroflavonol-4-reductase
MMSLALVTGANGFIGSHLTERLIQSGMNVRCLVRTTGDLRWLKGLPIQLVHGDVRDGVEPLKPAVAGVDVIFHLAGRTKAESQDAFDSANVHGTTNLAEAAIRFSGKPARFVLVSSQAAAGPSKNAIPVTENDDPIPVTPYGKSKLKAERALLALSERMPVVVVRPPSVYGPRDRDFLVLLGMISKRFKPRLGLQERRFSLIYVEDLAEGLRLAGTRPEAVGKTFFMTSESLTMRSFLDQTASVMDKTCIALAVPYPLFAFAVTIGDLFFKKNPSIVNRMKLPEYRERYWLCDGSSAETSLQFKPVFSFREGMTKTVSWYREQGWLS